MHVCRSMLMFMSTSLTIPHSMWDIIMSFDNDVPHNSDYQSK